MGNIIVGVLLLLVGFWMYSQYAPQWQQAQTFMGQLAQAFSPRLQEQVQMVRLYYFGSIATMIVGGIFVLNGLLQRFTEGLQGREKQK